MNKLGVYQESCARRGRSALAWRHEVGFDNLPPPHLRLPETRLSVKTETRFDCSGDIVDQRHWVMGPSHTPAFFVPLPGTRYEGRFILPEEAMAVLGIRPDEITDKRVPLSELKPGLTGEDFRLRLPGDETTYAARLIRASRGRAPLEKVADRVGITLRHLRRLMKERTGLSPKALARRLQVQAAIERADQSAYPDWADIALATGFSDQAHLIRSMRSIAGDTPARLHAVRQRQSVLFNRDAVT
ncbi:MAG: helix-turn-helix domain-containing protein [Pseudomonadota bacterium]